MIHEEHEGREVFLVFFVSFVEHPQSRASKRELAKVLRIANDKSTAQAHHGKCGDHSQVDEWIKGKDNAGVPFRYFRPDFQRCPKCGAPLERRATVQDKVLITLEGRFHLISRGYQCSRRRCPNSRALFVSPEPARLSLKGLSFGFDVLVQIGWWRFWEHRTLDEIALLLKAKRLPISRRHILNLSSDFLALLRAAQPAKIEARRAYFQRHGLVLMLDGMEPEQGNQMLFIVREANLDLTLVAETLYSSRADLISRQLLEPVKALGFRIRAGGLDQCWLVTLWILQTTKKA
ncbi:MAG: hypothetical protein HY741_14250 [Chloroflexi bacterium]|nr:hypothetical protein [Chloroflexota bacterium]